MSRTRTYLCERCNRSQFPKSFFAKVHVSEGHFAGNLGDATNHELPDNFRLYHNGEELDLNDTLACLCGEEGWAVQHAEMRCTLCMRPMLVLLRGEVRASFPVPMSDEDHALTRHHAKTRRVRTHLEI